MARLKAFAANIWARATGNVESPDANLFDNGWQGGAGANPPTSRHENWWHQRVDESLSDIERYGTMTWVAGGTYDRGTPARGSDGEIYVSTADANTNNPTSLVSWVKLDKSRIATESAPGNIEIATQAETDAGSLDNRAVTPLKLRFGFSVNLGTNGFIKFPSWLSGVTIQWGTASYSDIAGSITIPITFPTPYPNNVRFAGFIVDTTQQNITTTRINLTNSGFSAVIREGDTTVAGGTVNWISIGH